MKKTIIASAIALTSIAATNANANIAVTQMNLSGISPVSGSINDDGTLGTFTGSFFGHVWVATQETTVFNSSNGSWAGSNALGSWDYSNDIALMTSNQVAVGVFFDWKGSTGPILAVFDCVANICTGATTGVGGVQFGGWQTGAFIGAVPAFNGTGTLSVVPVPTAAWLMGSGLLGLVGLARRKKV